MTHPPADDVRPLDLAELVDLECRLLADRALDAREVYERDVRLATRLFPDGVLPPRPVVFRRWLGALRRGSAPTPGERVQAFYRMVGVGFCVITFLGGIGTATAVLSYDGGAPINILGFLVVFVGVQLALALLSILFMLRHLWFRGLPGIGTIQTLVRQLGHHRSGVLADRADVIGNIRMWHAVYGDVERWMLTAMTQRAAVFFSLGALVACLYAITTTALAFGWSTTLTVPSDTMARGLTWLAAPWSWTGIGVPSPALVEHSRYFPGGTYDPDLLGDWWPFLIAALVVYGLLPRLGLAAFAAARARHVRRTLPLDHADCEAAYERLTRPLHGWSGQEVTQGGGARAAVETGQAEPLPARDADVRAGVLCWGDLPLDDDAVAALVARRFGWSTTAVARVGGKDYRDDNELAGVVTTHDGPIVLLAEAWETPSPAIVRLIDSVRSAGGHRRAIVIGLVTGDSASEARDLAVWRHEMRALADPRLRVEPMEAS